MSESQLLLGLKKPQINPLTFGLSKNSKFFPNYYHKILYKLKNIYQKNIFSNEILNFSFLANLCLPKETNEICGNL